MKLCIKCRAVYSEFSAAAIHVHVYLNLPLKSVPYMQRKAKLQGHYLKMQGRYAPGVSVLSNTIVYPIHIHKVLKKIILNFSWNMT